MSLMKSWRWIGAAVATIGYWFAIGTALAADWKPADGPLMTRWAKDVNPDKCLPEYPRPQMRREAWLNLNGVWQLAFGKEGDQPPVGKDLPERILVPFPVESALSGVMKPAAFSRHRRVVEAPKEWAGQRLLLHFGAVDWQATVWLNGKKVGEHQGGYDGFTFDATDAVDVSKAEQELIVGVWDPTDAGAQPRGKQVKKPGGIFYTSTTGIWQTVWMEPVPQSSIEALKIIPNLDNSTLRVDVKPRGAAEGLTAVVTAKDGETAVASADGKYDQPFVLNIAKPKLWSPDKPFLYDLHVELRKNGKKIDAVDGYFGMRKIEVGQPKENADENGPPRVLLNGHATLLCGPLDQGFWPDGVYTAPTDDALKYDVEITKKLGFNMTRKHVKVEPDRWYYWCDKLGLAVLRGTCPAGDRAKRRAKAWTSFAHWGVTSTLSWN